MIPLSPTQKKVVLAMRKEKRPVTAGFIVSFSQRRQRSTLHVLERREYIEPAEIVLTAPGGGRAIIEGWQLTEKGKKEKLG